MSDKSCPKEPNCDEHEITEKEIQDQAIFELETADSSLLSGHRSRIHNLFTLFRVAKDFLRGFRALHFAGPCITIFGSARTKPGTDHYELARKMGAACAELGFTVVTGGGPGIMEAGNKGAFENQKLIQNCFATTILYGRTWDDPNFYCPCIDARTD